jgi:hypothetical protein
MPPVQNKGRTVDWGLVGPAMVLFALVLLAAGVLLLTRTM